jgi:hypothetical protein
MAKTRLSGTRIRAPRPGTPGGSGGKNYKKELDVILNNLNKEISGIAGRTLTGFIKSARLIRERTEKGNPVTPVDLGNLRASWFTVTSNGKLIAGGGRSHQAGGGQAFKGPNVDKLTQGHSEAITEAKGNAENGSNSRGGPSLIMGYSAYYAGYVHEMVGVEKWTKEGSGPKWFQTAIFENKDKILGLIRESAKIKK